MMERGRANLPVCIGSDGAFAGMRASWIEENYFMWSGKVVQICIGATAAATLENVEEVRAQPGKGLEGDRYFDGSGTFSIPAKTDREVTLIEMEALLALKRDYDIELPPASTRRNIVTEGVPLNHLVDREFQVGEARLRGIKLCEPCSHLERLTQAGIMRGLAHRGGLRAQVITAGLIRVGDAVGESP